MTDDRQACQNRSAFRALLLAHDRSLKDSADLIGRYTGRPCSYRTVKAWMADPAEAATARPCPDWAVEALRAALARPDLTGRIRNPAAA